MSIPLVFIPQKDQGLNVCDGGLRNNFPVSQILNDNPGTDFIGLYLGNPIFDGKVKSNSVISDVLSIWSESSDHEALKKYEDNIVVIDPHPIRTIDFWLTSEEKEMLLESGKFHALRFLKKNKIGSISKKVIEDVEKSFLSKKESVIQTRKNKRKKVLVVIVIIVFCFQLL
jgi:predicted acylesterase/phospholipase RssA